MDEADIMRRALTAIRRFDNLRINGPGWAGNSRLGFQFNPASGLAGTSGGGGPPPPVSHGACCYDDGTCAVVTQAVCEGGDGTYQGDNTDCDPNPCTAICHDTIHVDATICFTRVNIACCVVTVIEEVSFDMTTICPIDYSVTGTKYTTLGAILTSAQIIHRVPYPEGCDPDLDCSTLFNVGGAFFDLGSLGLFWDAGTMEWFFQPVIHFPLVPASFSAPSTTFTGDPVGQSFEVTSGEVCPALDDNSLDITVTFSLP